MRYVTNEQRRRRTLFKPTLWAVASCLKRPRSPLQDPLPERSFGIAPRSFVIAARRRTPTLEICSETWFEALV